MPKVVIENNEGFYKDLFESEEAKDIESFILGFREGRNVEKLCRGFDTILATPTTADHYSAYSNMFDLGVSIGGLIEKHGISFNKGLSLGRKNLVGKVKVV